MHVNQWIAWQPCFPDTSFHVLVTSPGQLRLLTSVRPTTFSGDIWKLQCMASWTSTSGMKSEPLTNVCSEQLRLISIQECRNVLHTRKTEDHLWYVVFRGIKYTLNSILILILHNLFLHSIRFIKIATWKSSHSTGAHYIYIYNRYNMLYWSINIWYTVILYLIFSQISEECSLSDK